MGRKTILMLIGVAFSIFVVACSSNANSTAETIPVTITTAAGVCEPPEHLNCPGADLTGANLTRANLKGADLSGANLTGVKISGANLTGAIMPDGTIHD